MLTIPWARLIAPALASLVVVALSHDASPDGRARAQAPFLLPAASTEVVPADVPSASECLQRSLVRTPALAAYFREYRVPRPGDETTFDLRFSRFYFHQDQLQSPQTNLRPVNVGARSRPARLCVVGGVIAGTQSRYLGWEQLKHCDSAPPWDHSCSQDGTALLMSGVDWYLADGVRIDNTMDALGGGTPTDRAYYRNIYARYIRDDCIGNDRLRTVVVHDSLFDGCYVGLSQKPTGSPGIDPNKSVTLDHVLLRLHRMPGGYRAETASRNHGRFFKWSPSANHLVINDSILLAEHSRYSDSLNFPRGTTASNVTIVWLGEGPYPGALVPGVQVTTDRGVWDRARADWLARHGCTSFQVCDNAKLINPDPPG